MIDTQVAYAAGVIDGEGCITIVRGSSHKSHICYNPMLIVSNTSRMLLETLQATLGGTIFKAEKKRPHKDCYHLKITGEDLRKALELVTDYLTMKQPEAVTLRTYLRVASGQQGKKLTALQVAERDAFVEKLQDLKKIAPLLRVV